MEGLKYFLLETKQYVFGRLLKSKKGGGTSIFVPPQFFFRN